MRDRRTVDELSIDELEEVLRIRRRQARLERLRQLGQEPFSRTIDPLSPQPDPPSRATLPDGYRKYKDIGASAQYHTHAVDDDASVTERTRSSPRIRWDWMRDKALLVIELGLLAGLILVLLSSLSTLNEINSASSAAQQMPTPAMEQEPADALITVAILPGGHTPPDSPGGSAPQEIPAHLRAVVRQATPLPLPTRGPEHAVQIQIPRINVNAPVVEGDDWESLKQGAGHHIGSANPGERGNCIISAHNDIFGEIFRRLQELDLGDEVLVHTTTQVHRYVVTQKRVIEPTDVSVMEPTSSPIITLISCYPYGIDTHRIVVIGELQP
ncbi:MAG: class D sortase [Chloroflexi bacterium]|nr:class D sortase [Chloroflexota bacterium]